MVGRDEAHSNQIAEAANSVIVQLTTEFDLDLLALDGITFAHDYAKKSRPLLRGQWRVKRRQTNMVSIKVTESTKRRPPQCAVEHGARTGHERNMRQMTARQVPDDPGEPGSQVGHEDYGSLFQAIGNFRRNTPVEQRAQLIGDRLGSY